MHDNHSDPFSDLSISTKLLINEAKSRGFTVSLYNKTLASGDFTIECAQAGKTILFNNWRTMFDSPIGVQIEKDKITTYDILERNNIAYPPTFIHRRNDSVSKQLINFLKINKPVVVKPSNTDHGKGISTNITELEQLRKAIQFALSESTNADILAQKQVEGQEYRFLVLLGQVIAVANRRPPLVYGDGVNTLRQLIDNKNSDPRRGEKHSTPLTLISHDEVARFIGKDRFSSIPLADEKIMLLPTSNLSRGGEAHDYTDSATQALKSLAVSAAKACRLGIAGIDIISTDIFNESAKNSYVIEVNSQPGLRMHHYPSEGQPRNVAAMIFDALENNRA